MFSYPLDSLAVGVKYCLRACIVWRVGTSYPTLRLFGCIAHEVHVIHRLRKSQPRSWRCRLVAGAFLSTLINPENELLSSKISKRRGLKKQDFTCLLHFLVIFLHYALFLYFLVFFLIDFLLYFSLLILLAVFFFLQFSIFSSWLLSHFSSVFSFFFNFFVLFYFSSFFWYFFQQFFLLHGVRLISTLFLKFFHNFLPHFLWYFVNIGHFSSIFRLFFIFLHFYILFIHCPFSALFPNMFIIFCPLLFLNFGIFLRFSLVFSSFLAIFLYFLCAFFVIFHLFFLPSFGNFSLFFFFIFGNFVSFFFFSF